MNTLTRTFTLKSAELENNWVLIDAKDLVLGRFASIVAKILRGKHKPEFTPHMDCGDRVVIINADKVHLTGRKDARHTRDGGRTFYRHTGFPGGIKQITARQILESDYPTRLVVNAVKRMLPKTKLGRKQLEGLYVYAGSDHPHAGQQPQFLDIASYNSKNSKRH